MINTIKTMLEEGASLHKKAGESFTAETEQCVKVISRCLQNEGKLLLCGNGGSAAECAHIAAEFTGRYKKERRALGAIALTTDLSAITAIGNDYGYDAVFERQVEALGRKGDVLVGLTTSGNSPNVLRAVQKAKSMGITTIVLSGKTGGKLKGQADIEMIVPSDNTPRIQEVHLTILHVICELIEEELF